MLISHFSALALAEDYSGFVSVLSDFRICCAEKRQRKAVYIKKYNKLKDYYNGLFPKKDRRYWMDDIDTLFRKMEKALSVKRITDDNISEISNLLKNLQQIIDDNDSEYLDFLIKKDIMHTYSDGLYQATYTLMENYECESAVFAAFKYLDSHLKSLLGVKSKEYYGEELINFAFSLKSGMLQLNSHANEQNGIRNFFSGANAVFRNPSAHRFVEYDDETAEAIIAMVSMMANLATEIKENAKINRK